MQREKNDGEIEETKEMMTILPPPTLDKLQVTIGSSVFLDTIVLCHPLKEGRVFSRIVAPAQEYLKHTVNE